jgi:hypothetical protein
VPKVTGTHHFTVSLGYRRAKAVLCTLDCRLESNLSQCQDFFTPCSSCYCENWAICLNKVDGRLIQKTFENSYLASMIPTLTARLYAEADRLPPQAGRVNYRARRLEIRFLRRRFNDHFDPTDEKNDYRFGRH